MDKVPTIAPSEFSPNSLEDSWMEPTRIEKSCEISTPALSVDVMVMAIEGSVKSVSYTHLTLPTKA